MWMWVARFWNCRPLDFWRLRQYHNVHFSWLFLKLMPFGLLHLFGNILPWSSLQVCSSDTLICIARICQVINKMPLFGGPFFRDYVYWWKNMSFKGDSSKGLSMWPKCNSFSISSSTISGLHKTSLEFLHDGLGEGCWLNPSLNPLV